MSTRLGPLAESEVQEHEAARQPTPSDALNGAPVALTVEGLSTRDSGQPRARPRGVTPQPSPASR